MSGIIVGVDGSAGSYHALDWALEEAAVHDLPVKVIHAWSRWAGEHYIEDRSGKMAHNDAATELVRRMLDDARVRRGDQPPVRASAAAIEGDPRVILTAAAERSGADLLVVASRGTTGPVVRLFLGSTAAFVAQHSSCPVVIVPAHAAGS